ncbi:hypothetical protein EM595_p0440 (plasmid) [Duffyella gerundensis]|uniref:Uncharacterized protein n=1 Tax=Duffyella gerundensis TaxID=1619313 RepID=A0A0U5L9X8_9GAMM|nr:hypothetical protein EM595_p0440 [Duffyella gerundensis]
MQLLSVAQKLRNGMIIKKQGGRFDGFRDVMS